MSSSQSNRPVIGSTMGRRKFLAASTTALAGVGVAFAGRGADSKPKAQIAITYDLEMSRHYPRRDMLEWDYQKGNLDEATKQYSVKAANVAAEEGGLIHFFCVGRVLEQPNIDWLKQIDKAGHPVGNHTYDHVKVTAKTPAEVQYRFRRAPWLVKGKTAAEVIRENIQITTIAMQQRAGIKPNGFRTPGGFHNGLADREDLQQMLLELGFPWISSKYPKHDAGTPGKSPSREVFADIVRAQADAQPYRYPTGLIEIPMSPISDVNAFRSHFWKLKEYLKAVELAVQWAIETGGVFDLLCHPSCMVVEDPKFETIRLICRLVNQAKDRAEIVGLDTVAERIKK